MLIRSLETEAPDQGRIETSIEMTVIAPESVRKETSDAAGSPEAVVKTYRPGDWSVERPADSSYHLSNGTILNLLGRPIEMKRYNRLSRTGDPVVQVGWQAEVSSRKVG